MSKLGQELRLSPASLPPGRKLAETRGHTNTTKYSWEPLGHESGVIPYLSVAHPPTQVVDTRVAGRAPPHPQHAHIYLMLHKPAPAMCR